MVLWTLLLLTLGLQVEAGCGPIPESLKQSVSSLLYDKKANIGGHYPVLTFVFIKCQEKHKRLLQHVSCRQDGKWEDKNGAVLTEQPPRVLCQEIKEEISQNDTFAEDTRPVVKRPVEVRVEGDNGCRKTDGDISCPEPGIGVNSYKLRRETSTCGTDHLIGGTVTYRCKPGYVFVSNKNTHVATCLANGHWDSEKHICYVKREPIVHCPDPGQVSHSNRFPQKDVSSARGFKQGDEVVFTCTNGFRIDRDTDQAILECGIDGQWDQPLPTCQEFLCSRPEEPENGWIGSSANGKETFQVGESIRFFCEERFKLDGKRKITCSQSVLGWSHRTPICTSVLVPERTTVTDNLIKNKETPTTNPNFSSTTKTTTPTYSKWSTSSSKPNSMSTQISSEQTTSPTVPTVQTTEPWNNLSTRKSSTNFVSTTEKIWTLPEETTKPPTGNKVNSSTKPNVSVTPGREVTYDGTGTSVTTDTTRSSPGLSTTSPLITTCDEPRTVQHGEFEKPGRDYVIGDELEVICDKGYRLKNRRENRIKCSSNGMWSGQKPICFEQNAQSCSDPGIAQNSSRFPDFVDTSDHFFPEEIIQFVCDRGHIVDGLWDEVLLTCENTGQWDAEIPICNKFFCEKPDLPRDVVTLSGGNQTLFKPGETITFSCGKGYELRGPKTITCGPDQQIWTAWTPVCKKTDCPLPEEPENGRRVGSSFRIKDTVEFVCTEGFKLRGSSNRTCLPNKEWSGALAICDRGDSHCPALGAPIGGSISGKSFSQGAVVHFTCGSEFFLVGPKSRTCLANRMWSGTETFCTYKISFSNPDKVGPQIKLILDTLGAETISSPEAPDIRQNNTCSIGIKSGAIDLYFIFDVSGSINELQLTVYKSFAKAVIDKLGVSADGTNVALLVFNSTVTSALDIEKSRSFTINQVKNVIDDIQLRGGGTSTADAFSYIKKSLDPESGRRSRSWAKNVAILLTDGRHNMGGDPSVITGYLKLAPFDMDIYCFGVGYDVDMASLYSMASSADKYWVLETAQHLANVKQYFSEHQNTSYDYCGQGGLADLSAEEGSLPVTDIRQWPWVATIYDQDAAGSCAPENLTFICGATLIERQWLLTAKSCLERFESSSDTLVVSLGATEFKDISISFDVERIIPNKNDRGDIALVKLKQSVIFTPIFRPVCISYEQNQAPVSSERSTVSRGDAAVGFPPPSNCSNFSAPCTTIPEYNRKTHPYLHQTVMQKSDRRSCKNVASKQNRLFNKRYFFCATQMEGATSFRQKGFPYMEERNGQVFQTGILSWTAGRYSSYTKVNKYASWIKTTIDENLPTGGLRSH